MNQRSAPAAAGPTEPLGVNSGPCACGYDAGCVCGDQERYVRNVARGHWTGFHKPAHRAELTEGIRRGSLGEYSQIHEPLESLTDQALADAVLSTWHDYARCECM